MAPSGVDVVAVAEAVARGAAAGGGSRQVVAAAVAAAIHACARGHAPGCTGELEARLDEVRPVLQAQLQAASQGGQAKISGSRRARRNLAVHNFQLPIEELCATDAAAKAHQRGGRGSLAALAERVAALEMLLPVVGNEARLDVGSACGSMGSTSAGSEGDDGSTVGQSADATCEVTVAQEHVVVPLVEALEKIVDVPVVQQDVVSVKEKIMYFEKPQPRVIHMESDGTGEAEAIAELPKAEKVPKEVEPWVVCAGCLEHRTASTMVWRLGSWACASCWDEVYSEVPFEDWDPVEEPVPVALAETCPQARSRAKKGRGGWRKR